MTRGRASRLASRLLQRRRRRRITHTSRLDGGRGAKAAATRRLWPKAAATDEPLTAWRQVAPPTPASATSAATTSYRSARTGHERARELVLIRAAVPLNLLLQPFHPPLGVQHALLHQRHSLRALGQLRLQPLHLLVRLVEVLLTVTPVTPRDHRLRSLRLELRLQIGNALRGRFALRPVRVLKLLSRDLRRLTSRPASLRSLWVSDSTWLALSRPQTLPMQPRSRAIPSRLPPASS